MRHNKPETVTGKKPEGSGGANTMEAKKTVDVGGVLDNTSNPSETELARRGSEHGLEVVAVVDEFTPNSLNCVQ